MANLTLSGTALHSKGKAICPVGMIFFGGAASYFSPEQFVYVPDGGLTFGGAADTERTGIRLLGDVIAYLVSLGLIDGTTGWTGYKGYLPPSPDSVIVVYETPGADPELVGIDSEEIEYDDPGFQIRGRGPVHGYDALRGKMGAIYRALHGSTLGSPFYVQVRSTQSGPMPMGLDDKSRPGMTWNFVAMRRRDADS